MRGLAALAAVAALAAERPLSATAPRETLRLGFTFSMFTGVNENDAKASIKALAATISRERGIPADPEPLLFKNTEAVAESVRSGEVDAVAMSTEEFRALQGTVRFDRFLMVVKGEDPAEKYVVLVHRNSGVKDLAALRGKRLGTFVNSRMSLGPVWLEVQLARAGLPAGPEFFASVIESAKLSKVVLDVFFRKLDACLVSRRTFATMAELNPQLNAQLTELMVSPDLVPNLFGFRADLARELKEKSLREFSVVNQTPSGRQALMIFQVGQVAERPLETLASALALLDDRDRLRPEALAGGVPRLRAIPRGTPNPTPP